MGGSFLAGRGAPHADLINELRVERTGCLKMHTAMVGEFLESVRGGKLGRGQGVNYWVGKGPKQVKYFCELILSSLGCCLGSQQKPDCIFNYIWAVGTRACCV